MAWVDMESRGKENKKEMCEGEEKNGRIYVKLKNWRPLTHGLCMSHLR